MATECCTLVGGFEINIPGCFISASTSSKAEFVKLCGDQVLTGPAVGSLSLSAYVGESIYVGCSANAGVSMPWISKYDCINDTTHFLFGGEGNSYTSGDSGDIGAYATKNYSSNLRFLSINANASSGPASFVQSVCREEGYGLNYSQGPISFNTANQAELVMPSPINDLGAVDGLVYLQSFSLELSPGNIPTASYSFIFAVGDGTCP
jgi:hypothetical protein